MESTNGNEVGSTPVGCLLGGQHTQDARLLLGWYFTVCSIELLVPRWMSDQLHLRMEQLAGAASPEAHAQLLCTQQAMKRGLMGTAALEPARQAALLNSLVELEAKAPHQMGKVAVAVRWALSQYVTDPSEGTDVLDETKRPKRLAADWSTVLNAAYNTSYRVLGKPTIADDVSQEAVKRTFLADWRTGGTYGVGGLITYARVVAYNETMREIRKGRRYEPFIEHASHAELEGWEDGETQPIPRESIDTEYIDFLSVPFQLSQLRPKDGLLVCADLMEVPREMLAAWLKKTRNNVKVQIFNAWSRLGAMPQVSLEGRPEMESILGKIEPFCLALAEAVLTSQEEWPDDDPTSPDGGSKGGRKSKNGTRDKTLKGSAGGDSMAHNKNGQPDLKSPLAMLLEYAARTKKRVPRSLLMETDMGELDTDICDAIRTNNPAEWKAIMERRTSVKTRRDGLTTALSSQKDYIIHVSQWRHWNETCPNDNDKALLIDVFGVLSSEGVSELSNVLKGIENREGKFDLEPASISTRETKMACRSGDDAKLLCPTDSSRVLVLNFSAAIFFGSSGPVLELKQMIEEVLRNKNFRVHAVSREPSLANLFLAHGYRTSSSYEEAIRSELQGK